MSQPAPPALRLLFFGPVRECVGAGEATLDAETPIACDELWARLLTRHPQIEPLRPTVRLARNGEFLLDDATLRPGDEVALIPPVSGG